MSEKVGDGIGDTRTIRPLVYSPKPPARTPPAFSVRIPRPCPGHPAMHNMSLAPVNYPPVNRHNTSPTSMNNVMSSMRRLDIGATLLARPWNPAQSADTTPVRHRTSGSVDRPSPPAPQSTRSAQPTQSTSTIPARYGTSGSGDQESSPAPQKKKSRHTREDPMVVNGRKDRDIV